MNTFKQICQELGVPLAEDKSFGPTFKFLGLEIDTVSQLVRVPEVKSAELSTLLQEKNNSTATSIFTRKT